MYFYTTYNYTLRIYKKIIFNVLSYQYILLECKTEKATLTNTSD